MSLCACGTTMPGSEAPQCPACAGRRTAIGYCRVSTDNQATEGVSLEAQRARIAAWCEANDLVLDDVHVDAGLSGGRADNRPALQNALDAVCRTKGVLVVYSLSRLARSVPDMVEISERLEGAGADFASITESFDTSSPTGVFIFRILSAVAEWERNIIRERTRDAMEHKRGNGERVSGKAPLGWRFRDGRLVEDHTARAQCAAVAAEKSYGRPWVGVADSFGTSVSGAKRMMKAYYAGFPKNGVSHRASKSLARN